MSRDLTSLATRYAGRPLLLTPRAAQELADRVRAVDHGAAVREGRFRAMIRKLSGGRDRQRLAMDDDDGEGPDFGERAAYAPRYVGEPEDHGFCWSLSEGVALINIEGPLLDRGEYFCGEIYHGYDTILAALREASADERVRGIFVRVSSPGGLVAGGLSALAAWMRENRESAGGKPIHVYADMACSAAFWFSCSADRIWSPRVGLTGSTGAVIVHENWAQALDKMGVEITPIVFGAKKTDGAWWEALSDSAREDLQAEIDQCGRDFVADVVAGRPQLTAEEVLATEARVFMGHHDDPSRSALALKFIDEIASEEEAFTALRDHVANGARTFSTPAPGTPAAAAPREGAPATSDKEARVAKHTPKGGRAASAITAAREAVRRAQADLRRAEAAASAEAADDEDETEDLDPEAADDTAPAEDEDQDDPQASADDEDAEGDAKAIAASAEAQSQPALAMAAIRSGQSLSQFKASVAALGGQASGGRNQLASTLGNAPRLGADVAGGGKGKTAGGARRSAAETYAQNTKAGLAAHGRR